MHFVFATDYRVNKVIFRRDSDIFNMVERIVYYYYSVFDHVLKYKNIN